MQDAETAFSKLEAGASLIQLYSALVYHGPNLVAEINKGLAQQLEAEGLADLSAVIGRKAGQWAA